MVSIQHADIDHTGLTGVGGGGGDLVLINSVLLASSASNMEISSSPGTYKDLIIAALVKSDSAGADTDHIHMRLGGASLDTGTNYRSIYQFGGTGAGSVGNNADIGRIDAAVCAGSGSSQSADVFSAAHMEILNYASTADFRMGMGYGSYIGVNHYHTWGLGFQWRNAAAAITIVRLYPETGANWVAGSRMDVYGRG
jgi:hypothetical protein